MYDTIHHPEPAKKPIGPRPGRSDLNVDMSELARAQPTFLCSTGRAWILLWLGSDWALHGLSSDSARFLVGPRSVSDRALLGQIVLKCGHFDALIGLSPAFNGIFAWAVVGLCLGCAWAEGGLCMGSARVRLISPPLPLVSSHLEIYVKFITGLVLFLCMVPAGSYFKYLHALVQNFCASFSLNDKKENQIGKVYYKLGYITNTNNLR